MNHFDIDEWEDMLPVERKFEKQHPFTFNVGSKSNGPGIGMVILWVIAMLYIIVDAIVS